ncbi:uncharacterized protein LOC124145976 [Haliotis rufescens]|uniref:uncharacterized protein LOC124145976 n=1 Tax=Haliotis rufescens TaxID=6454 RepID=UPI001EB07554|nr:uncharacterized protein LOC124145976 [Haliotis rufescens]
MAASCSQPLVTPVHYDPAFKVTVRLHESLLSGTDTPTDIEIEMMSLCGQLDLLCRKELTQQPSHRIDNGKTSNSFVNRARVVYDQMHQLLARCNSPLDVQAYLESKWLDRLFPRAAAYVVRPEALSIALKKTTLDNYYTQLAGLHHLATLARQMNNDLSTQSKPKYIAHQLALLYQSITNLEGSSSALAVQKKNIEDNFKTVKAAFAADQGETYLAPEIREWLLTLTNNLATVMTSLPAALTEDMQQPAAILARA